MCMLPGGTFSTTAIPASSVSPSTVRPPTSFAV
jgi:hypothetical protein